MREPTMVMGIDNNGGAAPTSPPQLLLERLKDYGQEHVFALWDELSPEERHLILNDIQSLDLSRIDRIIRCSLRSQGLPVAAIEPVPESCVSSVEERTMEERERWLKMGLKAVSEGKLAVLLLSGGQGTRLGSSDPKGCFNIGLPSGKSLFQLQAERILCAQSLAAQAMKEGSADQVTFFQQVTIPCISKDGRYIMETRYKVAKSPDGNGGVYSALKSSRLLEDMTTKGIKYVDCYGVDNALVRVADPTFLGYFIDKGVAASAKVVRKAYPQEKVCVFVRRGKGGPLTVVEYSELDQPLSSAINQQTGRLRFCWSNVCLHMFTLDFLNQVANGLEKDSIYHLAEKKIPSIHGYTMGLKLEQFIFDAFPYAPSTALFEVLREEEFAPVKNANGSNYDTPDSARLLVLRLHTRWVVAAGGFLTHSVPLYATGVEVSPLCSYAGENLESICRGRTFHAPCEITF
ncbi:N-acetylglucosamine-1-phosphate uridylyltransferase 2 [Hibiscus trionum]|uniref:N-acetylglucosamine-1-phosphate uridylyltransferase 2 n=1 Tax=Hibiscus trionum TaxID=183268 RepID=A0A9W7JBZ9_HIBTR|nr:N-acetylglucosamine-1-phosphate uridylyltransferase 2 [Hibiscus trionum]